MGAVEPLVMKNSCHKVGKASKDEAALILQALSAQAIRQLERKAKAMGLGERILIENASSGLAAVIDALCLGRKALIVAGKGNNGADVLSCGRKLLSRAYDLTVAIVAQEPLGEEVIFQKSILEKIRAPLYLINEKNLGELTLLMEDRDFILDGILGIGVKGEVSSFLKNVITVINEGNKKIVSCDIPSGLSPDTGVVCGAAIKADYTVSFLAPKQGFFLADGRRHCGKIFIVDIGISRQVLESKNCIVPF